MPRYNYRSLEKHSRALGGDSMMDFSSKKSSHYGDSSSISYVSPRAYYGASTSYGRDFSSKGWSDNPSTVFSNSYK